MNDPLLGRTIATRYRLISRLGTGRLAAVYLARHVLIERLSAIKIVHPHLGGDAGSRDRFLREARAVNRINHPSIVEISDYGESEGLVYLVMEYVPGESLAASLTRGPLGWKRAAGLGLQIASALGRAHEMGVIHRDLRPANVLLIARKDGDDRVKLTDFGGAKLLDAAPQTAGTMLLGEPGFTAPEHRYYGAAEGRSDLFSLGVLLYLATSGVLPFGDDVGPAPAPPPRLGDRAADVPPFFDDVVMTLLAADPDDRPRDGFEVEGMLRRVFEGQGVPPAAPSDPGPSERPRSLSSPPSGRPTPPPPSPQTRGASRQAGPHLTTAPFHRVAGLCVAGLARVVDHARASGALGRTRAEDDQAFEEAKKLTAMVEALGALVVADSRSLEASEARARGIRADYGRRVDELVRQRSKTLGWAGTLAERTYHVQAERLSGDLPVPTVEAMVWEQAALEQEEDRVREKAAELSARITGLEAELDRKNEQLERELLVAGASLEGRVAALRALALEAWLGLEDSARRLGVPVEVLRGP